MLTKYQLRTCALFLRNASASVQWVSMMLYGVGDSATAARLNEILGTLSTDASMPQKSRILIKAARNRSLEMRGWDTPSPHIPGNYAKP